MGNKETGGGIQLTILHPWNLYMIYREKLDFPGGSVLKNACQCKRCRFDLWVRKIPWRRKWQPTPVFLPGKSHGQRSLVGYSPLGAKQLDTTE